MFFWIYPTILRWKRSPVFLVGTQSKQTKKRYPYISQLLFELILSLPFPQYYCMRPSTFPIPFLIIIIHVIINIIVTSSNALLNARTIQFVIQMDVLRPAWGRLDLQTQRNVFSHSIRLSMARHLWLKHAFLNTELVSTLMMNLLMMDGFIFCRKIHTTILD